MLELVRDTPNWLGAVSVALTRPVGVPERRRGEDPWIVGSADGRPPRITDDLAWFRQAYEQPAAHGLRPVAQRKAIAAWEPDDSSFVRLARLDERHVLEAAGFTLSATPAPVRTGPRFERPAVPRTPTR
jgi:hypothetical protein